MNRDESFLRVKIRKRVLPLLKTLNPKIAVNLAKMSGVLQEEIEGLEEIALAGLNSALGANKDAIDVKALREMSPAKRKRVLRLWLQELRGNLRRLDMEHFSALERLISSGTGGKRVELPGGETVALSKGKLIFRKTKVEKSRTGI
jgi:tRNA(Ile)-lysidine synthase